MKSELPKVLVPVCGRPMIDYVLDALDAPASTRVSSSSAIGPTTCGHAGRPSQRRLCRTARAARHGPRRDVCRDTRRARGPGVVVAGDSPLMQASRSQTLLAEFDRRARPASWARRQGRTRPAWAASCATRRQVSGDRRRKGRHARAAEITRSQPELLRVRLPHDLLVALDQLRADNAQGEYYITDCPGDPAAGAAKPCGR